MEPFDTRAFLALADLEPLVGVSLYLPVDPRPPAAQLARRQLQNLGRSARSELVSGRGMRSPDADAMLQALLHEFEGAGPWPTQARGLALFAAPGFHRWLWLPMAVEPTTVIGDRLYLQPLLPLLSGAGAAFSLLALGERHVRLYTGNQFSLIGLHAEGLPARLDDVVTPDDPEQSLQFHTITAPRTGPGHSGSIHHGHGGRKDVGDHALQQFVRAVDRAVCSALVRPGVAPTPLVLACVERLLPIYRAATGHPDVLATPIAGDPEHVPVDELHRRAWQLLAPRFAESERQAQARLAEAAAKGRAVLELDAVVEAARSARIADLFLAPPGTGMQLADEHDQLDIAAVETLRNHGVVHPSTSAGALAGRLAAAVLRY